MRVVGENERQDELLACPNCNSTTMLPGIVGAMRKNFGDEDRLDEIYGGTDILICAQCLAEGNITVVSDDCFIDLI